MNSTSGSRKSSLTLKVIEVASNLDKYWKKLYLGEPVNFLTGFFVYSGNALNKGLPVP